MSGQSAFALIVASFAVVVLILNHDWFIPIWFAIGVGVGFSLGITYAMRGMK